MRWISKKRNFFIMVIPTVLLYLGFIIIPVIITVYYSFMDYSGIGKPEYIGIQNYVNLFHDPIFFRCSKKHVYYTDCFVAGAASVIFCAGLSVGESV